MSENINFWGLNPSIWIKNNHTFIYLQTKMKEEGIKIPATELSDHQEEALDY